jgi:hypothetical protein
LHSLTSLKTAALLILSVAAILAAHLTAFGNSSLEVDLRDALHAPGFGLFAALLSVYFRRNLNPIPAYSLAIAIAMATGVLAESLQFLSQRTSSSGDLRNDLLGTLSFCGLLLAFDRRIWATRPSTQRAALAISALAAVTLTLVPVAIAVSAFVQRANSLPVLLDFEKTWQESIYRAGGSSKATLIDTPDGWRTNRGVRSMQFEPGKQRYGGFFIETYSDWSKYRYLTFRAATLDSQIYSLVIRIHDVEHNNQYSDRFNRQFSVTPEEQLIVIDLQDVAAAPKERSIDMSRIVGVGIFLVDAAGIEKFIFDDFALANENPLDRTDD